MLWRTQNIYSRVSRVLVGFEVCVANGDVGFDPSTLRVADLRRIFVFHEVDYPSSAKKADLVQIFRDEVSPRADELLKQVENVEPTSAGIVDAPRRRTTRSASPAKSSAPATKKAPASPRKSPTKGRKTSAEKKEEKVPELSSEPLLKPPKEEQPDEEKKTSSARSPSPKKKGGRKTLSKPFVEPTEDVKEEKKPVVDTPSVYKVGGKNTRKKTEEETPAKPKKAVLKSDSEDKMDVDKKEEEDDEGSPFSDKNIFQTGTPPTKSRKSVEKKRSFPFDVKDEDSKHKRRSKQLSSETPSSQDKATPQRAVDLSSRKSTPGTALRHFSSFPSTPDDEAGDATAEFITPEQQLQQSRLRASFPQSAQQPSAAPPSSSFNDHTYKPATEKVNKRLSFMPDISDLKMSNQFSQQLHEDRRKSSPLQFSKPDPDQPETVLVETGQANPKSPPPPLEQDHEDVEVKKLEDEVKQEEEQEEEVKEKPSKPKKKKSRKTAAVRSSGKPWTFYAERIFGLFVVSAICGYIYWWCQERVNVGYCDVGFITDDADFDYEQEKSPLELVVDQLRPECVPCPAHATCYPHFKAICDEDFKYRENLFSFGGLLPIPPTCLPDTEKQHRIMALSSRAKQILRERNAEVECGYIDASTAAIEEDDLRDLLYKDKKAEITDEEWNDLWRQAVKDLDNEEDIIVR